MEQKNTGNISLTIYPPVVSVLGHVDHGKTSLLDAIRKTNQVSREHGGITQRIGASSVETTYEGKRRTITFIDTPGHEAFANMRSQGVNASDIVLLVVAADDGVMPQTQESIQKILEAKIPFIVVFTKADLPTANITQVKNQLMRENVLFEDMGGDTPSLAVSAKTGENIAALLDLIMLVYELSQAKKEKGTKFLGVVIDSRLDKRRGIVVDLVVKSGLLSVGDRVFTKEKEMGKVRALFDTFGISVKKTSPGEAVEFLGATEILSTGALLFTEKGSLLPVKQEMSISLSPTQSLAELFQTEKKDTLIIVLKSETSGELEAIKDSLPKKVEIIFQGQGEISVADILLAKDFHALVLGFNVGIAKEAKMFADDEKVFYKTYQVIYQLLDEVKDAVAALDEEKLPLGRAQIIARFQSKKGDILGVKILEGRLAIYDQVLLERDGKIIGKAKIVSLKRGAQNVKEVGQGTECGVATSPAIDFSVGDMILSHNIKE